MGDLEDILRFWSELEAAGTEYVLATVVAVEGSNYRKPGALMLIAADGRREGTVSGGCLEAEVARRAFWLTEKGPVVKRYTSMEEEGERPYGSGCGGVVSLLLDRRPTAGILLRELESAFKERVSLGVATVLEGPLTGFRSFSGSSASKVVNCWSREDQHAAMHERLSELSSRAWVRGERVEDKIATSEGRATAWGAYYPPRPGIFIFGAGDDAQPLHRLARELGWFVSVADGRSHLATRARFPGADEVSAIEPERAVGAQTKHFAGIRATDAAVVMTHSFEQDARILSALLVLNPRPAFIGVLGPQRRTRELLLESARLLGDCGGAVDRRAEEWLEGLHAPVGLDLGAESSATVALSIVAEIQKTFSASTGLPLRRVRAVFSITGS